MTVKRILVAINSLVGRDAAFEQALALARTAGAELYVLHAVSASQRFSFRAVDRLERMKALRQRAADAGVGVHTVEQQGDPAEIIGLHAGARAIDLIVIGAEARRGWGRNRSIVAERVVRATSIPTLIVASDRAVTVSEFQHALVALDLSPSSKNVLGAAIAVMGDAAKRLTVMHAVRDVEAVDSLYSPALWMVPEYRTQVFADVRQSLEAILEDVPAALDTRVHVTAGATASTILDSAADVKADLVVVGGSTGFMLRRGTALRVLRNIDRPLLVVPSVAADRAVGGERKRAA